MASLAVLKVLLANNRQNLADAVLAAQTARDNIVAILAEIKQDYFTGGGIQVRFTGTSHPVIPPDTLLTIVAGGVLHGPSSTWFSHEHVKANDNDFKIEVL